MERGRRLNVRRLHGLEELAELGGVYDRLAASVDAPLTARWTWLWTWARTHPSWCPLAVVVEDGGEVVGAALLAHRRRGPLIDVTALGHGQSDYARFPALGPEAGDRLGEAIAEAVGRLGVLRRLRLDGFPRADPVLARVVAGLRGATVTAGQGAPVVRLTPGVDPASTGRREARTMTRKGRNRLATDGRVAELETVTDPDRVRALLPELEEAHRARDRAVRGRSEIDDPEDRTFFYEVCSGAAVEGTIEVSTLRIDGELAAYLLAFLDGSSYRVWDPRMSAAHARYNPGHLLRADVLARVAGDGRFASVDWMRGEERYKLATTSDVVPSDRVLTWSPPALGAVEPHVRRLLSRARPGPAPPTRQAAARRSAACAAVVESALDAPALVIGTPPPAGRDLDLVLRPDQLGGIAGVLRADGFASTPAGWVRWARVDGRLRADVVEIGTIEPWGLPDSEQQWLWTDMRALPGHRWLQRPSPAAVLLLTARRFAATGADPRTRWADKLGDAGDGPAAWETAAAHAPAWGVCRALAALRRVAVDGRELPPHLRYRLAHEDLRHRRRRLPHLRAVRRLVSALRPHGPRRPGGGIVALSGLDGAGKSSQAELLATALADLGVPATTVWTRLSYRDWLNRLDQRVATAVRLARSVHRRPPAGTEPDGPPPPPPPPPPERPVREFRRRHPTLTWCWAWVVALDAVAEQRRTIGHARRHGTVVVCDRYTLDSAAHLRSLYGDTTCVTAHVRAVRALSPRPLAAFMLRIGAEEAHRRKPEEFTIEALSRHARFYDLEARADPVVTVLDGSRDVLDLGEAIATTVLRALYGDHGPPGAGRG